MKLNITNAAIAVFCMLQVHLFATNEVDIRFSSNTYDKSTNTLYVDIQVRNLGNQLVLAGQNYRIYYDASELSLNEKKTKLLLPINNYSEANFHTVKEGIDARSAGQLDFDKNLGFANFSIDLIDQQSGGVTLKPNDEWLSVATLQFKVMKEGGDFNLVWGRESRSDSYATAYVEMAEWLAPKKIKNLRINEYFDLNVDDTNDDQHFDILEMSFGPNPSRDIVKLSFNQEVEKDSEVVIRDVAGKEMSLIRLAGTSNHAIINISNLPQGNYLLELRSKNNGTMLITDNLVKM